MSSIYQLRKGFSIGWQKHLRLVGVGFRATIIDVSFQKEYIRSEYIIKNYLRKRILYLTDNHPSKDGNSVAKITKIVIADDEKLADSWFQDEIASGLKDVEIEWVKPEANDGDKGIVTIQLTTPTGVVKLN